MNISEEEKLGRQNQVIREAGGIYPIYEAFYIEGIIYSAGRAKDAFVRFDESLKEAPDAATVIAIAHEALTHTAGLSRFFWSGRDKPLHKARAKKLREAFDLDETSPLSDRELRNALEHFDEHLDKFLLQDLAGHFFPSPVVGSVSLIGEAIDSMFRLVDPTQDVFVLLGEKHSFGPLRKTVDEILQKAHGMNVHGGRLR